MSALPRTHRPSSSRRSRVTSGASLDRAAAVLVALAGFSGIFASLPYAAEVHVFPKYALFTVFTALAGIAWFASRATDGGWTVRSRTLLMALSATPLVAVVSAALSGDPRRSFLGDFDSFTGSAIGYIALATYFFLVTTLLHPSVTVSRIRTALGAGGTAASLVVLARTFLPLPVFFGRMGISPFSVRPSETAAICAGFAALAVASALAADRRSVRVAWTVAALAPLSVTFLIGHPRGWAGLILGVALAVAAAGSLASRTRRIALLSLAVVALPFVLFGTPRIVRLALPAEPSYTAGESWSIARDALTRGPVQFLVGSGAGSFAATANAHRPVGVNAGPRFAATDLPPATILAEALVEGGVLMVFARAALAVVLLLGFFRAFGIGIKTVGLRLRGPVQGDALEALPFLAAAAAVAPTMLLSSPSFGMTAFAISCLAVAWSMSAPSPSRDAEAVFPRPFAIAKTLALAAVLAFFARAAAAEALFGQAIRAFAHGDPCATARLASAAAAVDGSDARYALGVAQARADALASEASCGGAIDKGTVMDAIRRAAARSSDDPKYHLAVAALARSAASADPAATGIMTAAAERAVASAPTNPAIRLLAGDMARLAGDPTAAGTRYAEATQLKPDFAEAYLHWADLSAEAGDLSGAFHFALNAWRLAPGDRQTAAVLVTVAMTRRAPGDDALAESVLTRLLTDDPSDTGSAAALAQLYEMTKRYDEARAVYASLERADAGNPVWGQKLHALPGASTSSTPTLPSQ